MQNDKTRPTVPAPQPQRQAEPRAPEPRELADVVAAIDRLTPWPTLRLRCALLRNPG